MSWPMRKSLSRRIITFSVPRQMDDGLLLRMIKGIATRSYQDCAEAVLGSLWSFLHPPYRGRFIKASAEKLRQFRERSLSQYDLVALFIVWEDLC